MTLEEDIYRYTVRNAFKHDGKANVGAVVGKIIALHPEVDVKKVMPQIQKTIKRVNDFAFESLEREHARFEGSYELKPQEKEEGLPKLDWAGDEEVVTRYAPNPNGPFHLGNARAAILSHEFAKEYKGKFILRFEDTDPKIKKPIENAEQIFKEDLQWLDCKPDETVFQSDRLDIYYEFMKKLVQMGKAYVCDCPVEEWRALIKKKQGCICRELSAEEQMERFKKMLNHKLKEGQAVLRLKTDLEHKDPSVRDFWLARVVDNPVHPRHNDKHVWPAYNLASAIDDHELGITLILRGQEHAQNQEKQEFIYRYLDWVYPHSMHFGRVALEDSILSTSKIKQGIEEGNFVGWDDPRLGTIRALRRRGFTPEALRQAILDLGTNPSDATVTLTKLFDLNKKQIDGIAERVGFLEDPIKFEVRFTPAMKVDLPLHPDFLEKGLRSFELKRGSQAFLVSKRAIEKAKVGDVIRLRHAYNVKITQKSEFEVSGEFVGRGLSKKKVLVWLLPDHSGDVEIVMPDNSRKNGLAEAGIWDKKVGEHLQLEGFGYVRLDEKGEKPVVWFTHP
jgi:glutamyl-tRNA synthetase